MAARGYWQAFSKVKKTVAAILNGEDASALAEQGVRSWYREMFQPCVQAGALSASAMAGFRGNPVYLRTSRFVPPRHELLRDAMDCLFDLLKNEPEPSVRAVLGHWFIGYIHPYPDGNGRTARFLMNIMLASGGYPWTIIRSECRTNYLAALDKASIDNDIRPFASFVAESVKWSLAHGFQFVGMMDSPESQNYEAVTPNNHEGQTPQGADTMPLTELSFAEKAAAAEEKAIAHIPDDDLIPIPTVLDGHVIFNGVNLPNFGYQSIETGTNYARKLLRGWIERHGGELIKPQDALPVILQRWRNGGFTEAHYSVLYGQHTNELMVDKPASLTRARQLVEAAYRPQADRPDPAVEAPRFEQ